MDKRMLDYEMRSTEAFFRHVVAIFDESEAGFAPNPGEMTVAQQIAHVAQTVDWYIQGASRPEGFDLDFEGHFQEVAKVTALAPALEWLGRAFQAARDFLANTPAAVLEEPLPAGMVLGGVPKKIIYLGIIDHTAHHRGSLSVYARSLGKTPPMPYEPQVAW